MRALGFDESKSEVLKVIRQYDKNDDGTIVFDDFFKVSEYSNIVEFHVIQTHKTA